MRWCVMPAAILYTAKTVPGMQQFTRAASVFPSVCAEVVFPNWWRFAVFLFLTGQGVDTDMQTAKQTEISLRKGS